VEKEILTTEKNYVASLNILVDTLLTPLRTAEKPIIDRMDLKYSLIYIDPLRTQ